MMGVAATCPSVSLLGVFRKLPFFVEGGGCVKNYGSMNFVFCLARGSVDPCFALFILTAWLALGAPGALAALLFAIMCIGIQ